MSYPILTSCPVCTHTLSVTQLHCSHCETTIENTFALTSLLSLSQEQLHFVEIFLVCRGNIKEVEKELGISYPTVRGKLNDIVQVLRPDVQSGTKPDSDEKKIVEMLETGEISADEALKLLKKG
ncbi:MAG TPA: DUF2089 domain-containing protein [Candidatus Angelobacter sp.]|nr:DUF2089 domain-containing protein [Candidatus Angelobacter sp.]